MSNSVLARNSPVLSRALVDDLEESLLERQHLPDQPDPFERRPPLLLQAKQQRPSLRRPLATARARQGRRCVHLENRLALVVVIVVNVLATGLVDQLLKGLVALAEWEQRLALAARRS